MTTLRRVGLYLRFATGMLAGMALLAVPVSIVSLKAFAEDEPADAAMRVYFAIPFIAGRDPQPVRLGMQLLYEDTDAVAYSPLDTGQHLATAFDLGFTRDGLAKFDINGADARPSYEMFARAIGLTPREVELCREADCIEPFILMRDHSDGSGFASGSSEVR